MMDSNYSPVPNGSHVELQTLNEADDFASQQRWLFPDDGNWENELMIPRDTDDDDFDADIDDYTLLLSKPHKESGIPGAVFNLTTTIIGAGMMALPATMKVLGIVLGLALMIVIGILSEISAEMLVKYAVLCKAKSYGEVVEVAMGRTARVLSEICIIINNAGVLVVYLIIIGDVMSGSVHHHHHGVLDQWLGYGFWDHRKILVLVIMVFFLAPLCSLNRIDSLSTTSAASVALAVVFVIICLGAAFTRVIEGKSKSPNMSLDFESRKTIMDLLVVIPVISNAYVCHFNVQPVYNELEGRSPQKMNKVVRITTTICIMVYASTATSGYLLFGQQTESDILTNFDKNLGIRYSTALNYIVRVGYVLHLVLVFPVIHFSLRETVDNLVFNGSAPLVESKRRSSALTAVLLVLIYLGSTVIPNIWTAFKYTGATTAVSLGFTFPALIALRLGEEDKGLSLRLSMGQKCLSWSMLILAVIVSVAGTVGNIIYCIENESDD
ncbi:putative Tetratricopeptide repeat-like superfamily protein [Hibiscus syriacus]|uniref:Tetratricopeptide repeat-like superfamily protein n=1 Tax=Hibiscus syriacus TaxID=106335 RepID=A0A6A2YND6_HIBSY|nr:amino acid transporter AVT6E-like [Hibiscus syriacus]KAE8680843.1 putative Tetratricopeptide repeat-like superfamily protein [Hibiscus syriacus]